MPAWALNTEGLPPPDRLPAWEGAMQRLRLSNIGSPAPAALNGNIFWTTTTRGTEFAHLRAGPQSLSGRDPGQPPGVWLGIVVDGEASLDHQGCRTRLPADTLLYGPTGTTAALRFTTDFRLLLVTIPGRLLAARLIEPVELGVQAIGQRHGMLRVLFDCLHSIARVIDDLSPADLTHLESACAELLIGALQSGCAAPAPPQRSASALRRILQAIEADLDDPDLSLGQISGRIGLSPRTIQKAFYASGQNFTAYVRRRRLARCHHDLCNPAMAARSISEICFAHGFSDTAHFSKAFRAQYDVAPRQVRRTTTVP